MNHLLAGVLLTGLLSAVSVPVMAERQIEYHPDSKVKMLDEWKARKCECGKIMHVQKTDGPADVTEAKEVKCTHQEFGTDLVSDTETERTYRCGVLYFRYYLLQDNTDEMFGNGNPVGKEGWSFDGACQYSPDN